MSLKIVSQAPIEIFISYSRKDRLYAEELKKHLRIYEYSGGIEIWYDADLTPGEDWEEEIYRRFCSAKIILLLVSPDFFNSEYCAKREMKKALERHEDKDAIVVPVIIRSCDWKRTPVKDLMVLPTNSEPINKWPSEDEYYESVSTSLFKKLDELIGVSQTSKRDRWTSESEVADQGNLVISTQTRSDPVSNTQIAGEVGSVTAPGVSPEDYCRLVRAVCLTVVVCFVHSERRQKLRDLRKWSRQSQDPLLAGTTVKIEEARDLEDAIRRVSEEPETTVLLLDGFEPGSSPLDEVMGATDWQSQIELITNSPEWNQFAPQSLSASVLRVRQSVTSDETLFSTLRKSLLRMRTRQFAAARVLDEPNELAAFFELRYRIWSELDYLSEEKKCPECPWELDYTDRTSLPLGLFSKIDGTFLGGARLVRSFGEDYPKLIHTVMAMLEERNAKQLRQNFEYPTLATHPFDILGELDRFKDYYRGLVKGKISKAELSRVVVAPEYRQLGLGEVIVDTMCGLARVHAIQVVFLACHSRHADFYGRCQFNVVVGVEGRRFLSYRVPCIAMERHV